MQHMRNTLENKESLSQLVGLIVGAISGVMLGLVMTKRADDFDFAVPTEVKEIVDDEQTPAEVANG